jgi:hypothetical protein
VLGKIGEETANPWRAGTTGRRGVRRPAEGLLRCGLVASYIAPPNPEATEFRTVPQGWIPSYEGEAAERAAKKKLRGYFRQMGCRWPG